MTCYTEHQSQNSPPSSWMDCSIRYSQSCQIYFNPWPSLPESSYCCCIAHTMYAWEGTAIHHSNAIWWSKSLICLTNTTAIACLPWVNLVDHDIAFWSCRTLLGTRSVLVIEKDAIPTLIEKSLDTFKLLYDDCQKVYWNSFACSSYLQICTASSIDYSPYTEIVKHTSLKVLDILPTYS